ncbi:sodium/proline symporter PutP [Alteromonas aestuariivivens]|uniref:Sodium/proline symporter n=1 Tax=Alteromonas aestuariivivens TaxID=1938339 RepID=A0A3D8M633_9ALTE|nr:sodium/proline symporter PutP [Alteromonas aestuariivivens]RDV25197.1 sodium/proline symporter PutP [Alteromonas aestuariivivens]
MATGTIISLGLYFLAMLGIGFFAYRQTDTSVEGYMLGGRQLGPAVTALSAGASDMSGWMLMGLPGAMYVAGISAGWIAVGLIMGALANYYLVAPRLRVYTEVANNSITLPDYFENRFADDSRLLRVIASVVIVIFFTLYTSSGVVAGGKLFETSFNLSYEVGLYVTAGVVVAYTLVGGFMAVSMTDFVQGCIMFVSLVMVPFVVIAELGGPGQAIDAIQAIDPALFNPFKNASSGQSLSVIGIVSLMAWGLGYFGQPHIIVRFMAIRSVNDLPSARRIGMSWMVVSIIGALATGLFGMAYVTAQPGVSIDPETVFIYLSQILFHPLIGGFLLAAILAAIMSTISSQLLVTSSSLTSDFYQAFLRKDATQGELVIAGRISVVVVALTAIFLAYDRNSTILNLVSNAWAGFGAAFGPLVLFSLFRRGMTRRAALGGMIVGAVTVLLWIYLPVTIGGQSLSNWMYEIVPGFVLSSLTIVILSKSGSPRDGVTETFDRFRQTLLGASTKP